MIRLQKMKWSGKLLTSLLIGLLLAVLSLLVLVRPTWSAVAALCTVGPGPYPTIQSAIADLNCDPINVPTGTYGENLVIARSLTLQGTGTSVPVIDGGGTSRTVTVDGAGIVVRMSGFQITGGDASADAPTPLISGRIGGGVLAQNGATLYLENSRVYSNVARGSGNGSGIGGGVAVYTNSVLHGQNLQIDHNVANASNTGQAAFGGGLAVMNATAYLTNSFIYSNTAKQVNTSGDGWGGGIYVAGEGIVSPNQAVLYLTDSTVQTNTAYAVNAGNAGYGGGLFIGQSDDTRVVLSGNTWQENTARPTLASVAGAGNGGAVAVDFTTGGAELTISGDTFSSNVANAGNTSEARGGAIFLHTSNTAGFITATLTSVTMSDNIAKSGSGSVEGQGGAIYGRHANITVDRATVLANQAATSGEGGGGGIYIREPLAGQALEVINSILADNTALGVNGDGAQIHADYSSGPGNLLRIVHTTIANDGLNPKQGIYYLGTSANDFLAITNTLIASHTAGIDNANATGQLSGRYLLFFGNIFDQAVGTTAFPDETTWFSGDPLFVDPAAGNYHIKAGSAAIDAGTDAGVVIDIDGDLRPQVGPAAFDIGADEAVAHLAIAKYGPATAGAGLSIQYTLYVTNSGYYTAQNLVLTDSIPAGATYVSGGSQVGNSVQWNSSSLPAGQTWQESFTVTAQTNITNDDYGVNTDHGIYAVGANAVTTVVSGQQVYVYLPLLLK